MPVEGHVKTVFMVMIDDEGRVGFYPFAICESKTTAERLALAQGPAARVSEFEAIFHNKEWCAPFREIESSPEDKESDRKKARRQAALDKARAAGLTDEDLQALGAGA